MSSIYWVWGWTLISVVSLVVRVIVLRQNIIDHKLLRHPDLNPSPIMLKIQNGHLRLSVLLSGVSGVYSVVGIVTLYRRYFISLYDPAWVTALGYLFIFAFFFQSIALTILAWFDMRIPSGR